MGVRVDPEVNDMAALLARAAAARAEGDLARAERLYAEAADHWPGEPEPRHHLAGVHLAQGRLAEAEADYRRTLARAPNAGATRRVLATLLLSQGRFAEGFVLFEARHELPSMAKPALGFPEWRGEPVAGKRLLIWPEQGFGDQIMAARFAPVLKAMGAAVTLVCAPPLARLFAGSLGVEVIAAAGAIDFPDPDYWVMSGSLPGRLGVTVETIPGAPYLRAPQGAALPGAGRKLGLMTRGNPQYETDAHRSLPAGDAEALRGLPARIVDLDPAATGAADFADTAALIAGLDLVISVDTAAAHLAGAMGKPCWVLLPAVGTDWRWLRRRSDSPWYPSMRLYRQLPGEDWAPVIARLAEDFRALG
jgi:tetratricopeptide (TPR) repeat protein